MDDPRKSLNLFDIRWMWSMFGTAIGAGILFLPIRAGRTRVLACGGDGAFEFSDDLVKP